MTPTEFQRAESVFHDVLAVPESERQVLLARLCGGDAALKRKVEALLATDAKASSTLRGAVEQGLRESFADVVQGEIGTRIGPYLLVRAIGEGGMGSVYQAIRADGEYLHTVAIKLLHKEAETDETRRRFRAERQMLATLNHPNIASLLDGGQTTDGRPYLVMEFVEGDPLLTFCHQRQLPVDERLRLFRQVCDAVHYAHQRHIVHRDLKPGNILIAGAGTAKLVDFGIAKAMLPELVSGEGTFTKGPMRYLTPAYASPEQIIGAAVSPRTDVFALGVVLYELLTGRSAFGAEARSPMELHSAICREEPVPATQIAPGLPPEIDAIIARCVKKDPGSRYASAAELKADIDRLLAPASAAPPRRSRGVSVAAAFAAGCVAGGLVMAGVLTLLGR